MGPVRVVELLELAQGVRQVRLVPDQGPFEQLAAAGLHPAFHERVHSRHLDPAEYSFDARVSKDGVEQAGELAVAVPDQEPRPAAGILKIHDQVPRGLGDPGGPGGCCRHRGALGAGQPDSRAASPVPAILLFRWRAAPIARREP
jgi:hypothetical protein